MLSLLTLLTRACRVAAQWGRHLSSWVAVCAFRPRLPHHSRAGTSPEGADGPEGRINVRFRRLHPDEDKSLATCNIVVMEVRGLQIITHACTTAYRLAAPAVLPEESCRSHQLEHLGLNL